MSSNPKTIFITGATGFIGSVITELAIKQGYKVRGLSRREEGDTLLQSLGATPVRGTLTDHALLSQESSTADIILHLAYDHDFSKPQSEIVALEKGAVDALATPLIGTNKPLVVTHGTALVIPDPDGGETDETAPFAEGLIVSRHIAEQNGLSWKERDVRVIVIRLPQYVYGRSNRTGFAARLIKMAVSSGEALYLDDGEYCFSDVYVDDAAELYLLAAEKARAGDVFNGTGHTTTTYRAMAEAIGDSVGVPVKSISREDALQRWGPIVTGFVGIRNRASNAKALRELGWKPVGPGLLWEVREGSYRVVAEEFQKQKAEGKI